jgi:DNA-binding NtrC family response regulator
MKKPFLKSLNDNASILSIDDFSTIGSDDHCQVHIKAEDISERHARIEKKDSGYMIRDLRSQQGTFVNGARILEAFIEDGDIIQFGSYEMMFMLEDEVKQNFPLKSKNEVWHKELQALGNVSKRTDPVLILGPSGTGKDVIAKALHETSERSKGPFVSVNCSALSETLIESELFGHIRGSFTGAMSDRKGAFEAARGGTLFLDEIGDLTYALQAKLLRALENGEIRPVGADHNVMTNVRIIAATHQDLAHKIREGEFRSDLYFRLNVITVTPPALIYRMEDFEELLYAFAKIQRVRFSHTAIVRLKKHSWPGNIRELKNLVSRAAALFPKELISEDHVEKVIDRTLMSPDDERHHQALPVIKEIEKQMIIKRLVANKGNQRRTASDLGMPKSTLHDRLKYYNIDISNFKIQG